MLFCLITYFFATSRLHFLRMIISWWWPFAFAFLFYSYLLIPWSFPIRSSSHTYILCTIINGLPCRHENLSPLKRCSFFRLHKKKKRATRVRGILGWYFIYATQHRAYIEIELINISSNLLTVADAELNISCPVVILPSALLMVWFFNELKI